jgi:hypothetical protein
MKTEVKAKLAKRCPCCGSDRIMMDDPKWLKSCDLNVASIWCKECGLTMNGFRGKWENGERVKLPIEEAYRNALIRWNKRSAA